MSRITDDDVRERGNREQERRRVKNYSGKLRKMFL